MNKLTKAGIATGAAVALLMGGAGTLAYWNSTANLGAGSAITAGNLTVTASGTGGAWARTAPTAASSLNIAAYRIVPGDTLTYTRQITVVAQGDTLVADLGLTGGAIAPATSGDAEDIALAADLAKTATFSVTSGGSGVVVGNDTDTIAANNGIDNSDNGVLAGTIRFTPGANATLTAVLNVVVTISYPFGTEVGNDNDTKTGAVSLADFGVTLTQRAAA